MTCGLPGPSSLMEMVPCWMTEVEGVKVTFNVQLAPGVSCTGQLSDSPYWLLATMELQLLERGEILFALPAQAAFLDAQIV